MNEDALYECPMPETFRDKLAITVFLAWLFYLGFVSATLMVALLSQWLTWRQIIACWAIIALLTARLTIFFPAAYAALSRITHPSMRSVTSAMGPPLAFLIGGG